jgi:hypothetical protein
MAEACKAIRQKYPMGRGRRLDASITNEDIIQQKVDRNSFKREMDELY